MKLITLFNFYRIKPSFHIENSQFYPNYISCFFSLVTIILIIIIISLYLVDVITLSNQINTFIEYNSHSNTSIHLSKDNFIVMLSIIDANGNYSLLDSNIGTFNGGIYVENKYAVVEKEIKLNVSKCDIIDSIITNNNNILNIIHSNINNNDLHKMYCVLLEENNLNITTNAYNNIYIKINFNTCNNNNIHCKSNETIVNYIKDKTISIYYSNYRTEYNKHFPMLTLNHNLIPLNNNKVSSLLIKVNKLTYINEINRIIPYKHVNNYYISTTSYLNSFDNDNSNNTINIDLLTQIKFIIINDITYIQVFSNRKIGCVLSSIYVLSKLIILIFQILTYRTNNILYQSLLCSFYNEQIGTRMIRKLMHKMKRNSRNIQSISRQSSSTVSKLKFVHFSNKMSKHSNNTLGSPLHNKKLSHHENLTNPSINEEHNNIRDERNHSTKPFFATLNEKSPMHMKTNSIPNILPLPTLLGFNNSCFGGSSFSFKNSDEHFKPIARYMTCKKIVKYLCCVKEVKKEVENIKLHFHNIKLFFDVVRFLKLYNDVNILRECILDDAGSKELESSFALKKNSETIIELYEKNFTKTTTHDDNYTNVKILNESHN